MRRGRRCHQDHIWLYGSGSADWGHGSVGGVNEVDSPSAVPALDPVWLVGWRRGHGQRCAASVVGWACIRNGLRINDQRMIREAMRKNQREKAGWELDVDDNAVAGLNRVVGSKSSTQRNPVLVRLYMHAWPGARSIDRIPSTQSSSVPFPSCTARAIASQLDSKALVISSAPSSGRNTSTRPSQAVAS